LIEPGTDGQVNFIYYSKSHA